MGRVRVISPAPFLESRALLEPLTRMKPFLAGVATYQLARAATYGFSVDGRLLAVLGFFPLEAGIEEAFLVGREPSEVVAHLVPMARATRLILAGRLHSGVRSIVAHVACGHEPGQRLARLCGFGLSPRAAPGPCEVWELTDGRPGERDLRRRRGR